LDRALQLVEKQYAAAPSIAGAGSFEKKVGEGLIFYALGQSNKDPKNFERAAILLFDVVETEAHRSRPGYDDAVNALADCLFVLKYRYGARTYYRLLADRNASRHVEGAIVRLIELAAILDNYEGLDDYYTRYEQLSGGRIKPEVRYARGKLLLRRGRLEDAEAELGLIPAGDPYHVRSRFLRAVVQLKRGQLEEAVARFGEVVRDRVVAPEDKEVQELAHMARGRIFYEMGRLAESADAYQEIDYRSKHFPEMLYEVSWTFVKRGQGFRDNPEKSEVEYQKAVQALDLLLISNTDRKLESEVRILRGNLLLRLAKFDEAEQAFQAVVDDYSPTLKALEIQMAARGNAETILDELLRRDARTVTVDSVLPPLVQEWAAGDESVENALGIFRNIEGAKTEVAQTRELADKLLKVFDSPNRLDVFPALREGRARSLAVETSLLTHAGQVAEAEARVVMQPAEALPAGQAYLGARETRRALERKLATIPRTTESLQARRARLEQGLLDLDKLAFKSQLEIDNIQAQISAIDAAVRGKKVRGELAEREQEYWRNELQQVAGALEQIRSLEKDIRVTIREERGGLTLAGGVGSQENLIKNQYLEVLRREAELAKALRPAVAPALVPMLVDLDAARQRGSALITRLNTVNESLRRQVDAQAAEMRGIVMLERTRVDEYERQVGAYEGEAGEMAAALTHNALQGVRDKFYDVVLRADVGLVDLAWQLKQDRTDAVSTLVKKQKNDLKALDDEFSDVLRDME
jgi:tetratricopeptide (TPR) repeat protein